MYCMSKINVVVEIEDSWDEHLEGYEGYLGSDEVQDLQNGYKKNEKKNESSKRELEIVSK
jgi:hypothetical protein